MLSWYSGDKNMIEPFKMEEDPDGTSQQVAVIMTGKVYREAGLKQSKHPEVEGLLYDKLCQIGKHKLRDDVRRMALSIALSVSDKEFQPTIAWLDNFMRRFCLSKKKMGFHSSAMLKQKGSMQREIKPSSTLQNMTQEDVFSVLGFSADCDPTLESGDSEKAATSGQTTVHQHSSQSGNSLINCNENESNSETPVQRNGDETSGTGGDEVNDVSDTNVSTTDNVDIPIHRKDGACNENDEKLDERVDKETDTVLSQEISSTHKISKENGDKVEELVILDDNDADETSEAQNSCGSDSKIGKISIKKFEDLCEASVKKEKDSGKTSNKKAEEENSNENEDDSEETEDTENEESEEASESDTEASQQETIKDETESITYSKAETKYYNKNLDTLQKKLKGSVMKCTSCYEQVNHHIRSLVFTHPVLGLFICKKCRKYYGKGKFRKDREGYDEYCRLCAEGGDLLCCEQEECFNGFCKRCVKRTMGRAELKRAETTEGWSCYVCSPEPLMELRALHRLILSNLRSSEEEDANLSRKDLKSKTLKNKFESLKQMRQMRSQREAPSRSKSTETVNKNCEDNKTTEAEEEKIKKDIGKSCIKVTEKDQEIPKKNSKKTDVSIPEEDNKPCPVLRNAMDEMIGMLSKCLENIKVIDSKWKKSKYSSVGTNKARQHVVKQLEAMRNNFEILESDLKECSRKETIKENTDVKENNKEQSVREQKIKNISSKKDKPDDVEQMDSETIGNKEESVSDNSQASTKMVSSEKDGKMPEKGNERKNGTDTSEHVDFNLEAGPSGKFANSVDHCEDSSQHSSKACLPSDDEHSLPDLVDVIKEIISDPDEPMDVEEKMTMIKSLDMENEVPELLGNVKQKKKKEQKSDSKPADGRDEESLEDLPDSGIENVGTKSNGNVTHSEDKGTSNTKISNNRRARSASVDSRSGSDAEADKKVKRQHKKMKLDTESDEESKQRNGIVNEAGKASKKTSKVLDDKSLESEEEFEKSSTGDADKTCEELEDRTQRSVSTGNDSRLENDAEVNKKANQKSSQLRKRGRLSRDAEDDTEKEGNQSMQEKSTDKKNNAEEPAINSHVESEGEELTKENMNQNKRKLRKRDAQKSRDVVCETDDKEDDGRGVNTADKTPSEGNLTDTETSKAEEHESSSEEKTVSKKKKKSNDECDVSNAGKRDQRKKKCNKANDVEEKRTTRSKNRQGNKDKREDEKMEDDTHSGLERKSESSEENSDEEIQRPSENDAEEESNVSNTDKKDQRKKKSTTANDVEEKRTTRSKKKQRNRNKKRQKEELEDDIRLGLVNESEVSEEDSDEEIQGESENDSEEKKLLKVENDSEEKGKLVKVEIDSEVKGKLFKVENDSEEKGKLVKVEKKPILDSEKEEREEKDIDSTEMKDIKSCPNLTIKKEKALESDEDKVSDMELPPQSIEKKVPKKKGLAVNKENQKAKAAILKSDTEDELEDKPKPRSKKKYYRRHMSNPTKRKSHKKLNLKLTEEEMEELKGKQLGSKCQVLVETLSSEVRKKLDEEEFIYTSDHPELKYPILQRQVTDSDGCADDEEDSDKEFSKLMKLRCGKIKPGPKSKSAKLKLKLMGGEESEDCDDPGLDIKEGKVNGISENPDEDADNETDSEEKLEGKDKKKKKKVIRKKKEGLLDIDIDEEGEEENEDEEIEEDVKKKNKDGGISLNEKMKKHILMSSDEEGDEEEEEEDKKDNSALELEEAEREKKKHEKKKEAAKKKAQIEDSDEEYAPKVYKKGYMNLNISTDEEEEKEEKKKEAMKEEEDDDDEEEEEEEEPESAYEDDSDFEESPKKRRSFQISSSDSESGNKKIKKKKVTTEEESEEEEEKPKSRRKRIRKMSSSDDDDDDDDDAEVNKESPSKHKKIRKVIRDEDLMETTKNATQEEEERRKRIAERQKHYNDIFLVDVETDQKGMDKLVLDFDPETKSELVSVHEKLVKSLKPHQFKGIKFMWDATVESLERLKTKRGGGCILAHSMGLGKTLQVITFCHTLLTNKSVNKEIQRILVCCPVNTIFNWVAEFSSWLKGKMLPFDVIELASAKDLWGRAYRLDDWWREGGICIIGYSMFRNLSNSKNKRYKGKMKEIFQKTLVDPGPDLVVCDEGHMIKNEKTALSVAINKVRTMRRIILTGTPLQNNLKEYHCMIQFVKPNLLGTRKEFMNRFSNPIEQGQCVEAMPRDVRRMKRRAHILHNLLEGCVQRFDYTVLKPYLPPKFEYVVSVQMSDIQRKLYQYYLDNLARGGKAMAGGGGSKVGSGLFVDFGTLSRVWTHPKVLELAMRRKAYDEEDEELDDFICDDSTTSDSSDDERSKRKKARNRKNEESEEEEEEENNDTEGEDPDQIESNAGLTASGKVRMDWWKKVLVEHAGEDFEEEEYLDQLEHSGKLILLLDILRECCSIGDKVLLFSQSLLTLDVIEDFLHAVDQGEIELPKGEDSLPLPYKFWKRERDYLRLDGSTPADARKSMCRTFNESSNERCRLFLISTRAGGLGINLVGANRVIIFDSSWNPSHDTQSIFRVYRFGQKKPCYIYRFVAQGTMEEKIYSRQVTKMSTALRVVDEHQIKRYFKMAELAQLYEFNPADSDVRETPIVPKDRLLAELLQRQKNWIVTYHEHESLLENQTSEELSEEERKAAWEDYENEKKGFMVQNHRSVMPVMGAPTMLNHPGLPSVSLSSFSFEGVVNTIKAQNPNLSHMELCESVLLATKQIQKVHLNHYQRVQAMVYNLKNPMIAPEQRKLLPFGNHPEMLPMLEQQLRLLEENIQRENQVITHIDQGTAQRNQLLSTANLMSAGLLRGQPTSSGISSATANYVERPSSSSAGRPNMSHSESSKEKKTGSNDVILLD